MNKIENISVTVMEECAEIQQAVSKTLRFGHDSCNPLTPDTNNAQSILIEYYQLQAMMELLFSETGLDKYFTADEVSKIKTDKTDKFLRYQEMFEGGKNNEMRKL